MNPIISNMGSPRRVGEACLVAIVLLLLSLNACALSAGPGFRDADGLRETADLIQDVKAFGRTLGIEPTDALSRTTGEGRALSMVWLWLQRAGTLASNRAVDIRMAVGLSSIKEQTKIEQVYRVEGYSVYYRQGNEFADPRSAVTPSFATQGIVRRVNVILHEDLHGDVNFDLPWDIEEGVVTPLGSLAAVQYFKHRGDAENLKRSQMALNEGRQISLELLKLAKEAETIFKNTPVEDAKEKVLALLSIYPAYQSMFQRQVVGQHPATVLEAKLSHDLAYFRYFDAIAALAEKHVALKTLIEELKKLPPDATPEITDKFLGALKLQNSATTN
ncbi:MAG TPA: hypothetical protein VJ646_05190 [Candidatus Binatia bacterium]|nr:hypothetical protein [Candidatus Binatia bacterium]